MKITLRPGGRLRRHIIPVDSPARVPHCWRNDGNELLRILVVKVPGRRNRPGALRTPHG